MYLYIILQRKKVIKSYKTVKVFFFFFLLMEGSVSRRPKIHTDPTATDPNPSLKVGKVST